MARKGKVTIEDIAQHSSASITTVSMVLRDKPGIGAETRQRVLKAAQELGYQRRTPSMVGDRTLNVAMIVRSRPRGHEEVFPTVNAFYSWVMTGIEAAAQANRMNLLYATLPVDEGNRPTALPDHLLGQSLAGVLLIGAFSPETIDVISGSRATPTVLVDGPRVSSRHDAVGSDNEGGAYDAVTHLIAAGHRSIAILGPDPRQDPNFAQREDGYLRALRDHGLAPNSIRIGQAGPDTMTEAVGAAVTGDPELTAIFACNDAFAIESMHALERIDRRVPEDVSVIGFDDIVPARQVSPGLTTMAVDKVSMGRLAILMLDHRLEWPEAATSMTSLRPELRVRESVGERECVPRSDDIQDVSTPPGSTGLVGIGTLGITATTTSTKDQGMLAGTADEKRRGDGNG